MDRTLERIAARRASELWAANLLAEDPGTLRQPCAVPLVESIPFEIKPKVVLLYTRCVKDVKEAKAMVTALAADAPEVERRLADRRLVGAWVVLGGGGAAGQGQCGQAGGTAHDALLG
eukprot:COSAG02_NODE_70_length_42239_cov_15.323090_28_plen_118_part_00